MNEAALPLLLAHVDLSRSYLRSLQIGHGRVELAIDANLLPGHPRFAPARSGEDGCYVVAAILFQRVTGVTARFESIGQLPLVDPDGTSDLGDIDSMTQQDGSWSFEAEAGKFLIEGGDVEVRFLET